MLLNHHLFDEVNTAIWKEIVQCLCNSISNSIIQGFLQWSFGIQDLLQACTGNYCGRKIVNEFLIIVSQAARSAPPFVDTLIPERQFTR